ncbi:hypothetical protein [Oceanobacter mangrovi]|uniref:hypothetical protein n=1 Tax=Oceanobacter mangrovi TaxID=2862510 RepID=UPI001C8D66D7|nr:hypothetical protein [Oceanobacter mangrovi]
MTLLSTVQEEQQKMEAQIEISREVPRPMAAAPKAKSSGQMTSFYSALTKLVLKQKQQRLTNGR